MRSVYERRLSVLPRECDNDACDYETGVDGEGRPRAWWVHAPECKGLVEYEVPTEASPGSFLAYLLERTPQARREMLTGD